MKKNQAWSKNSMLICCGVWLYQCFDDFVLWCLTHTDGRQQLSFLLNNSPLAHSASPASSTWDSACNSKFTLTKEYPLKSYNNGGTDKQLHMSGVQFQHVTNTQGNPANGLFPSKTFRTDVLSPGRSVCSQGYLNNWTYFYNCGYSNKSYGEKLPAREEEN